MGIYFGVASGMWQMAVMSALSALIALGLKFRTREPKPFEMKLRARGIFVNGKKIRRPYRLWPKAWRAEYALQLQKLLATFDQPLLKSVFDSLNFVAGFGLELNLEVDGPHLFLVGPTGSGKSRFLDLLIRTISGEPVLLLADYKGGATLSRFGECITDLDSPEVREGFWSGLQGLLKQREAYLALHGVSRVSETGLAPVVVVVDEVVHAIREDRNASDALSAVAARGRSLGVHLICASQSVAGVPRELLVNLNLRIILAGTDEVDALQLGAKTRPKKIAGTGVGQVVGGPEFRFPFRREPILENPQPFHAP